MKPPLNMLAPYKLWQSSYSALMQILHGGLLLCSFQTALNCNVVAQEPEAPTVSAASAKDPGSTDQPPSAGLATKWIGKWKGEVKTWSLQGEGGSFSMELDVQPTSDPTQWAWNIRYAGAQGTSDRRYLLKKTGTVPGSFQIDEQNGILLGASMLNDSLVSHFSVGGQTLVTKYEYENDPKSPSIRFELMAGPNGEVVRSGGDQGVPNVESIRLASKQVAVLKREKTIDASNALASATWLKLPTESYRGKQDDIFFVNDLLGWYVNGAGKIFRTRDGGESWQQLVHMPGTYFRCIAFVDDKIGFAGNIGPGYFPNVTDATPLYKTVDGGDHWSPVEWGKESAPVGLCALQVLKVPFVNAGVLDHRIRIIGVGRVGGPAAMSVSDDLGDTWQSVSLPTSAAMAFDVHFFSREEGILASATNADVAQSNALILTTKDGGKTWTEAWASSRPYELTWKIAFPSRSVGYVTIQSYNPDPSVRERYVAKTVDGGATWSELALVQDSKVREFGIAFRDELHGWVGATPTGFETQDGGKTWNPTSMGNAVNKIRVLPTEKGNRIFAIGVEVHRLDIAR